MLFRSKLSTRNIELVSAVDNLRGFQYGLKTKIQNLEKENDKLKKKLECYERLFGKIIILEENK